MKIYLIKNEINGKVYIGKTSKYDEKDRFKEHVKLSSKKTTYFYRALQKYGQENFSITVLEETTKEKINEREIFWINFYRKQNGLKNVYNETFGGDGGDTYTLNSNRQKAILNLTTAQRKRFSKKSERDWASTRSKNVWQRKEYQEKIKNSMLNEWARDKERKNKLSIDSKKRWEDSEFREHHKKSMIDYWKKNKKSMIDKIKKSCSHNRRAKERWIKIKGDNFETEIKSMICQNYSYKIIMKKFEIKNRGQLNSILKVFFNTRSLSKIKSS